MPRGVPALSKLYCDLIANSLRTVTMDIPSDLGTGRIFQTSTKHGVIMSDCQMNYLSDVNVQGTNQEDYIQIIFCQNEGVSWGIANEPRSVSIKKGESCIYKGHGKTEYVCYAKKCDFSFRSIKIPITYFSELLACYFEAREISIYEKKLYTEVSKVSVTPALERTLAEIKDFVYYRGQLGYLYLDGKILELLAVYLSEVLELDILSGSSALSRTERAPIIEAKRIIDSQLTFAPSCDDLSRSVHVSATKLTKGFSSLFGMPVHAYIINQRLERAAGLLIESDMNISEVAAMVGYSKASNFAAAFKRKYGVVPKDYKGSQVLNA